MNITIEATYQTVTVRIEVDGKTFHHTMSKEEAAQLSELLKLASKAQKFTFTLQK